MMAEAQRIYKVLQVVKIFTPRVSTLHEHLYAPKALTVDKITRCFLALFTSIASPPLNNMSRVVRKPVFGVYQKMARGLKFRI